MEQKKINKWILVGCAALLVLAAAFAAVYLLYKPQTVQGSKQITVSVVFEDASVKEHEITTQQEYLRGALEEQGLVEGDESEYGLFIKTVDGVTADESKQQWWCITKIGEQVNTSVDQTPIADGDRFELTLTTGW